MKDLHESLKIFSVSDHLTREQLVNYHLDRMPKDERYEVEKHLIDCELCRDALSGIALMPDYKGIERIRKDIRRLAKPRTDAMNNVAWRIIIITAAVLSLILLISLFYIYFIGTPK